MKFFNVIIILSVIITLFGGINYVYANSDYTHIGIEYSTTCKKLIELGDYETCGDPAILNLGWESPRLKPSFQIMFDNAQNSEKKYYQNNNILLNHKKSCIRSDYCNVFDNYSNQYYWFNFDNEVRSYLDKVITINANMKFTNLNTINDEVFINATSRTLILDTKQINIRSCQVVAYNPENYRFAREMGGLIWYLLDDCKDYNKLGVLGEPYRKELELTTIPIDESPAWNILKDAEALKAKYKENRIGKD